MLRKLLLIALLALPFSAIMSADPPDCPWCYVAR
jgi:hypothetical protein